MPRLLLEPLMALATTPHTWLNDWLSASIPPRYLFSVFLHAVRVLPYVLVVALVVWYVVFLRHQGSWATLRLKRAHAFTHIALGTTLAVATLVMFRLIGSLATGHPFLTPESSRPTPFAVVSDALFHALPFASAHQLLLVGIVYQAFRQRLPFSMSSLLTALFFAVWLFPSELFVLQMPGSVIIGFISALLLEKRDSLIPCIAFHTVYKVLSRTL